MKFKVQNSVIRQGIATASTVIGRAMLPILNNLKLELNGNTLSITGSNIEQTIMTTIEVRGESDGIGTVPAKKLLSLLGSIAPNTDVSIEINPETSHCSIVAGTGKFRLLGLPADDFPMPNLASASFTVYNLGNGCFQRMIREVKSASAVNDTRVALNGIALHFLDGNAMNVIATDGKRLSLSYTESRTDDSNAVKLVIIPQSVVPAISKFISGEIEISVAEKLIKFTDGITTVYSKLAEGQYPNYNAVIPTSFKSYSKVSADAVRSIVSMLLAVSDDETIHVEFSNDKILFQAESASTGSGTDAVDADSNCCDPVKVRINARYLLDAIAESDETIAFRINDGNYPLIVERNERSKTVIMPIRMK